MRSISRGNDVYGRGNRLPVGRSKFFEDFVEHAKGGPFVPGTTIPRLKAIPLGVRAVGFFDDKIEELIEALGQLDNDPTTKLSPKRKTVTRRRGEPASKFVRRVSSVAASMK
jgi:hypothetical protein